MNVSPKERDAQESKARILTAARKLFLEKGFEPTTIRAIGAAAEIHPSLVIRYFHTKEELFLDSVQWDLHLPQLRTITKADRGRVLIRHFLQEWEDEGEPKVGLPTMLRVALSHPEGATLLTRMLQTQLVPALAGGSDSKAGRRAALIATQTLGLALTRYVLKLPPVVHLSAKDIEEAIGPTLQRYLDLEV